MFYNVVLKSLVFAKFLLLSYPNFTQTYLFIELTSFKLTNWFQATLSIEIFVSFQFNSILYLFAGTYFFIIIFTQCFRQQCALVNNRLQSIFERVIASELFVLFRFLVRHTFAIKVELPDKCVFVALGKIIAFIHLHLLYFYRDFLLNAQLQLFIIIEIY